MHVDGQVGKEEKNTSRVLVRAGLVVKLAFT